MSALSGWRRTDPQRPLLLDLGLAATTFFLWYLSGCWEVRVAASPAHLKLAVDLGSWQPQWPAGPWLLGAAGLLLAWIRLRFLGISESLQMRLQRATLCAAALLAVRLAALWNPLPLLFPFLTLLWSPHALWAVGLLLLGYVHLDLESGAKPTRNAPIALLLFSLGALAYLFYALYFCQVTMIHGDEGQYLRVTQSLLHDGDMDLANNLEEEQTNEFHMRDFAVHQAPGSPPGKIHSVHPIGLSVALLPAYWLGLEWWQNPRLATALFTALLAAACLPLLFLWLVRLGMGRGASLLAVLLAACTAPFFYFSNQLFPEVAALFVSLCFLLALVHWQRPERSYRDWGKREPFYLFLLVLLVDSLPFLHPRYASLALLAGGLVLLQAWHSPRRNACLAAVALAVGIGLYALLSFNYAFSDDWMGPFRPGNAWEEGALELGTWSISLPGHWLHAGKGLLNSSPFYFFALLGWAALARGRDRRLWILAALYLATAATNGLHPDWGFGFCFPARFLMTALPAILCGLAAVLPALGRLPAAFFAFCLALVIGLEGVVDTVVLTEPGYDGRNLSARSINHFYPLQTHFFPADQQSVPPVDAAFWLGLSLALFLALFHFAPERRRQRYLALGAAALLPFLWGRADAIQQRISHEHTAYMYSLPPSGPPLAPGPRHYILNTSIVGVGVQLEDGRFAAYQDAHSPGVATRSYMPIITPGIYQMNLSGLEVSAAEGQLAGHFMYTRRYTVPVVSPWETRTSLPLSSSENSELSFHASHAAIGYGFTEFSGAGSISFDQVRLSFYPVPLRSRTEEMHRFAVGVESQRPREGRLIMGANYPELGPGHYKVRFSVGGSTFSTFFERKPDPLVMAVFAGAPAERETLEVLAREWFDQNRIVFGTVPSPLYMRPLVESVQPPWWTSIPFVGDEAWELSFRLTEVSDAWFLLKYDGAGDLLVRDIILYREHLLE